MANHTRFHTNSITSIIRDNKYIEIHINTKVLLFEITSNISDIFRFLDIKNINCM